MDAPGYFTREQSRRVDELAARDYGLTSAVLMENAGRGVVDVLCEISPQLLRRGRVAILCGKGNNAGDGFVVARHLAIRGVHATAMLCESPTEFTGDTAVNFGVLERAGLPFVELADSASAERLLQKMDRHADHATWLVDALLGTGARGPVREPFVRAITWMNERQGVRRLAIDLPSGMDCDTGDALGACVRADVTCTFVAPKRGFLNPAAAPFLGDVRVVSIGVPPLLVSKVAASG